MATVIDLIPRLKGTQMQPGVSLLKALSEAHTLPGYVFVHQWNGVEGWHVTKYIPPVNTFFKVYQDGIYGCLRVKRDYRERLVGTITSNTIIMKDLDS